MSHSVAKEGAIDRSEAHELLIDLVSIPSVSGEEADCASHLVSFFEAFDREVWIDDCGNVRAPADDAVLLTSHLDTVPGDIPVRVEDGVLWGRGSVDAKGPLAAMAVASIHTGTSFVGVVREEVDSGGANHLVEDRAADLASQRLPVAEAVEKAVGRRGHRLGITALPAARCGRG